MRILLCNWKDRAHPAAGGAEVFTHEVLRRWVAWGHDIVQFCAAVPGRPSEECVDGVRTVRAGGRLSVYRAARRYYEKHARGRVDVVIDEVNTRPFLLPRFVDDVPVVALAHQVAREVWFHETPLPLALAGRYWLEPRWLASYREVPTVTISPSSRDWLHRYGIRDVEVVPVGMGPTPRIQVQQREERPTVVFVGRLARNKRPLDAVAAVERLRRTVPDARLWVVGSGPLERIVRATGPDDVSMWGHVDGATKFELMARAHALAVTSVREGWGLVVDEAASVGTATVAYDVPGLRDSVPAAAGALVDPHPEAMADALARVLPEWASRAVGHPLPRGSATWDDTAVAMMDVVQRVVNGAHAGRKAASPV